MIYYTRAPADCIVLHITGDKDRQNDASRTKLDPDPKTQDKDKAKDAFQNKGNRDSCEGLLTKAACLLFVVQTSPEKVDRLGTVYAVTGRPHKRTPRLSLSLWT